MRVLPASWLTTAFAATYYMGVTYSKPTNTSSIPDSLHQRYDYGIDKHSLIKRSTEHTVTIGIHVGNGPGESLPQRLEVRELEKDKLMWTLYILGLDMLQWTPQSDKLSWYQIMG
jgi:tyrosinase